MLRKLFALMLVMALCVLPAGCGQPEEPSDAEVSEPPLAAVSAPPLAGDSGSAIVIGYPCGSKVATDNGFLASLAYQQELFGKAGWSVQFKLLALPSEYSVEDEDVLNAVRTDITSGARVDCYLVSDKVAQQLLPEGQTMDLAPVVRQTAPALAILYGQASSGAMAGLPVSLPANARIGQAALILEKDTAADIGQSQLGISNVLDFLESHPAVRIEASWYNSDFSSILGAWAGEQGYYPLSGFGLFSGYFAKYGDTSCSAVPIEQIKAFDEFFLRAAALLQEGRIITYEDNTNGSPDGYIGPEDNISIPYLLRERKRGEDFLAFPLTGCAAPAWPDHLNSPKLLVVPNGIGKEAAVAAFVQELLTSQRCHDLLYYGQEDVDYKLVGGKVEYLMDGKPLSLEGNTMGVYYLNRVFTLFNPQFVRPTVYQPANYAPASNSANQPQMDLLNLLAKDKRRTAQGIYSFLEQEEKTYRQLNLERMQWINGDGLPVGLNYQDRLTKLHSLSDRTKDVVDACRKKVNTLLDSKK